MVEDLESAEEGLLPGTDPSAAGAALQGMLKPMVDRPDTRLTSVRTLPPVRKGEYAEVAVQMDMQTSTEGMASLLAGVPPHQNPPGEEAHGELRDLRRGAGQPARHADGLPGGVRDDGCAGGDAGAGGRTGV